MKRLIAVLLLALVAPGCAAQDPNSPSRVEAELQEFTSKEGNFTISFPGKPSVRVRNLDTAIGKVAANEFFVNMEDRAYYSAYSDFPVQPGQSFNAQSLLDSGRDGMVRNLKGKLLKEKIAP